MLLCYLLSCLNGLDPDVLVGHNVSAFDLDILLHRLQLHKIACQKLFYLFTASAFGPGPAGPQLGAAMET